MKNTSPDKKDIEVIKKVTEMCKELLNDKNVQATADKLGNINICLEQDINVSINISKI